MDIIITLVLEVQKLNMSSHPGPLTLLMGGVEAGSGGSGGRGGGSSGNGGLKIISSGFPLSVSKG